MVENTLGQLTAANVLCDDDCPLVRRARRQRRDETHVAQPLNEWAMATKLRCWKPNALREWARVSGRRGRCVGNESKGVVGDNGR